MDGLVGDIEIDCNEIDLATVSDAPGLETPPRVAVICDVPAPVPVASPLLAPTLATPPLDEAHETLVVMFLELPSLYVPVAVNCRVCDWLIDALLGDTEID